MFFHKTDERLNKRERERMNTEKRTKKSYLQNDSQEANENPYIKFYTANHYNVKLWQWSKL